MEPFFPRSITGRGVSSMPKEWVLKTSLWWASYWFKYSTGTRLSKDIFTPLAKTTSTLPTGADGCIRIKAPVFGFAAPSNFVRQ